MNLFYLKTYAGNLLIIINWYIVPVLLAVAFLYFLWGVFRYFILNSDDETKRETGRQFVLYGIIGFVIIFTMWGLVNLVANTFGLGLGGYAPPPPML